MDTQHAIDGFLSAANTEHTRRTYATPLRLFVVFLSEQESTPTVQSAIEFVPWLRARKPARRTIQLYLTAIYRFYRYMLKVGTLEVNPSDMARLEEVYRDARSVRGENRPIEHKLSAVERVIRAARSIPATPGHTPEKRRRELARLRDIAIVETLRATGCRMGELCELRLSDIDRAGSGALVRGKGSKWRKIYWDEGSWRALLAYLSARGVSEANAAPVFVSHGNRAHDTALTTRHVDRIIRTLATRAGVDKVTPHYFRHVFATRALDRTGNLALVQDLLGHASPVTTRVYAKTDDEQRKRAHADVWA